jgi:hypothetical protein
VVLHVAVAGGAAERIAAADADAVADELPVAIRMLAPAATGVICCCSFCFFCVGGAQAGSVVVGATAAAAEAVAASVEPAHVAGAGAGSTSAEVVAVLDAPFSSTSATAPMLAASEWDRGDAARTSNCPDEAAAVKLEDAKLIAFSKVIWIRFFNI